MKKTLILALLLLIGAAGYLYKDHLTAKIKVLPITYEIEKEILDLDTIRQANILFIGDQMGQKLARFIPEIIESTSKELQEPIKIENITTSNEGLHRTLAKVKQIKQLPEVIIYHVGVSEFYERRFDVRNYSNLIKNFKTFEDEKKLSLIMTFPFLSKFLYLPSKLMHLNSEIKKNDLKYPATFKQKQMELVYKFYSLELEELIKYIKQQEKTLILVTTPINFTKAPKRVCENATTSSIGEEIDAFERRLEEGHFKPLIPELQNYAKATVGNARVYFLLAKALERAGRFKESLTAYQKSVLFDCHTWRPTNVFNSIAQRKASSHDLPLVDFAQVVHAQLGRNDLFTDEHTPHDIYYRDAVKEIIETIKQVLDL